MKKHLLLLIVIVGAVAYAYVERSSTSLVDLTAISINIDNGDTRLAQAFKNHTSNIQIQDQGIVEKILPDDTAGSYHQRLIVRLDSGQTLLIAHNIDIATRVTLLSVGDHISFNGEYVWNSKGGVIHWIHHDPAGQHAAGWIKHDGQLFQ